MRIGDLLVRSGFISESQLRSALEEQASARKTPIGELLKVLNFLNDDDLELVLQAQRKILFGLMSGDSAVDIIKYAREHHLNFAEATEKLRSFSKDGKTNCAPTDHDVLSFAVPEDETEDEAEYDGISSEALIQRSDKASEIQDWRTAISSLERARKIFEETDTFSEEAKIPIYCRLAVLYARTNETEKSRQNLAAVTSMMQEGKMAPGSMSLLTTAAHQCFLQGMASEANQLYKVVMPKWAQLLPFESAQFNICLRDAISCLHVNRAPSKQNIRIGELLAGSGLIDKEQFQDALQKTRLTHQPLGRVLSQSGWLSNQDLRNAVRVQLLCRAAVLPAEYAAITLKAASFARSSDEFFAKLNVPAEAKAGDAADLADLIEKMDRLLIMEESLGLLHPDVAILANEIGDICLRRNETEEAEVMFRKAHAVLATSSEDNQLDLADACQKIARLMVKRKKYPEAELLFLQSMEIKNRLLGEKHHEVAEVQVDVGFLYFCQANYEPAIGFLTTSWINQQEESSVEQKRFLLELLIKCFEQLEDA
ncbi:MAG: hypothetical protein K2X81_24285, partial [Candidatus Obscuribacterales bacterium]|nr:hypothetical protein [Candidatus Obscuribacterales bacterium]